MKRGFMDLVVNSIVPTYPGKTAVWIATEALALDSSLSDAKDKLASLANTLSKQVQTGREKRLRRERINGVFCYFLVSAHSAKEATEKYEDVIAQMAFSNQELADIDNLVEVNKFESRSGAIKWLVTEGIKVNRSYLDKVADIKSQIEKLKTEV